MFVAEDHGNHLRTLCSTKLSELPVIAAFSTRPGGVSPAPFDSLNVGFSNLPTHPDSDLNISENRWRLLRSLDLVSRKLAAVRQVHGDDVYVVDDDLPSSSTCADALITERSDVLLAVQTADCVPVLMANQSGTIVAAIHAGWRGVVANVIQATVSSLGSRADASPDQLIAAIGPAISKQHFEVGNEVADQFVAAGLADAVDSSFRPRPHVDLKQACAMHLIRAGVPAEQIDIAPHCTFADEQLFFSHRRDAGQTGRHLALIARKT